MGTAAPEDRARRLARIPASDVGAPVGERVSPVRVGDTLGAAVVGAALGAALGDVGDALGEAVGAHVKADQSYGHAVLAESESCIARLLQSLSASVPSNMRLIVMTRLMSPKARGWLYALARRNIWLM